MVKLSYLALDKFIAYVQGAPIKNNPLEKRLYLGDREGVPQRN